MFGSGPFLSHENTTHCKTLWPTKDIFLSRAYILTNVAFSIIGTVTNLLLLVGLYKSKLTSQGTMKIICSLACSDFCVSAVVMPTYLIATFQRETDCNMHLASAYVFFTFAVNTANMLLILSTDRLLQISKPILYRAYLTKRHIQVLIICAWIASAATGICIFFTNPLVQVCVLLTIGMTFYTISVASYARILFVMHTHRTKIQTSSTSDTNNESARKASDRHQGPANCGNKRITFKLHVEVFESLPMRTQNMTNPGHRANMEQVAGSSMPKMQGAYYVAKQTSNMKNCKRTKQPASFLAVPEGLDGKKEYAACYAKATFPSYRGKPDKVTTDDKDGKKVLRKISRGATYRATNKNDCQKCENVRIITSSKGRHSRLEPVNFRGKDTAATVSVSKEMKATRTVAMVIITLFVCHVPYIWSAFSWAREEYKNNRHASQRLQSTYAWTLSIAFAHSSINPIILLARNRTLRHHVKEVLKRILS